MPIMAMIAFLLAAIVGIAILVAPEKDPPPPGSAMRYESRPENPGGEPLTLAPYREDRRPQAVANTVEVPDSPASPAPEIDHGAEAAPYVIRGLVVDARSQEPVPDVRLLASRVPSEAEESAFREQETRITQAQDTEAFPALIDEKQRLWSDVGGNSDGAGRFELAVTHDGEYIVTVTSSSHLKQTVEKRFIGELQPTWELTISLGVGATISGRVYDGTTGAGVSGLSINATEEAINDYKNTKTDIDGLYEIAGLSPGQYTVIADIEDTAYRVTKELPFRRMTIASPEQAHTGVDFKLDRGGVVWGYVTTPDNVPVQADVLLCTSESVLTQALSAMVRQAPPLNTSSKKEDGYYELVGVPLNEAWRLYATADQNAPQLAQPFLLTERQKEARVDIFMFTGSNVYGQVVDNKGKGIPGANVLCIPGFGQLLAPMDRPQAVRETRSDDDGYFEVRELPAGSYQVMAQKEGYKFALRGEPLNSNGYHEIRNFRVVLHPVESGRYAVFGTVRDASGAGLSGAKVTLSGLGTGSLQGVGRETMAGSGGAFEFEGVEIGTYMLRAEHHGYSPKTQGRVLLDEPNIITMHASATVRGRVLVKNGNRAPEGGYRVSASLLDSGDAEEEGRGGLLAIMETATSEDYARHFDDPQGHYEMDIPTGTWRLEARSGNYTPARQTITVGPGQVLEKIDFHLSEDGGVISGRVSVAGGASPRGALVSLIEATSASHALSSFAAGTDGSLPTMQVGDDGAFEFERLPEGTYNVIAQHSAYPQAMSDSIPLEAGGRAEGVEVRLGPGGRLEGYVYRNGRPLAGTIVTLVAGGAPYTGTSDESGYYEIRNIPEGEYEVFAGEVGSTITGDSIGGQGYPVIIADGLVTRQNFGDTTGVAIEILVEGRRGFLAATLNPPGAPVFRGDVELGQLGGYRSYVYGDLIRFEDIPMGEWQLDIYAGTGVASTTLRWVGTEIVPVTGEEPAMSITVFAQ